MQINCHFVEKEIKETYFNDSVFIQEKNPEGFGCRQKK